MKSDMRHHAATDAAAGKDFLKLLLKDASENVANPFKKYARLLR